MVQIIPYKPTMDFLSEHFCKLNFLEKHLLNACDARSEGESFFSAKKVRFFRAVVFSKRESNVVNTIKSNRK